MLCVKFQQQYSETQNPTEQRVVSPGLSWTVCRGRNGSVDTPPVVLWVKCLRFITTTGFGVIYELWSDWSWHLGIL